MITLLRQHYQFDLVTSKEYQTTIISSIKIEGEEDSIFFMPATNILDNLEIKNSQGRHMTVVSREELKKKFGIDYDIVCKEIIGNSKEAPKDFGIIPIICTPTRSGYDKIFATYTLPIKESEYKPKKLSPDIEIGFEFKAAPYEVIRTGGMMSDKEFELHLLIKVGTDYKIIKEPDIYMKPSGNDKIIGGEASNVNTRKYYVKNMKFGYQVTGVIRIGLADSLSITSKIISGVTIILPIMLLSLQVIFEKVFIPTLEILGGSIALLIGERVWVLKDRYIMRGWIKLQRMLIVLNGVAFGAWFLMYLSEVIDSVCPDGSTASTIWGWITKGSIPIGC